MSGHDDGPQRFVDEISRIRERLRDLNGVHHKSIRDQWELAMCRMMEFLNEKPGHLEEYIKNLRRVSRDDIGQALLDNMLEQVKQIKKESYDAVDLPDDDSITELDGANRTISKSHALLSMVYRLWAIERALHTHVGEPADVEN